MYDLAKKARAGMKSKAERLAGEKDQKTDSSDWSPAPELNADVKTGMRPVSRRAFKDGGKVSDCAPMKRADRKARKAGGRVEQKGEQPLVDRYINRDLKKANDYRDGKKHVGALKDGGRAKRNIGGEVPIEKVDAGFRSGRKPGVTFKPTYPVPTPPVRPKNLTPAANNKIKPDQSKYLTGDDITGPPKIIGKKAGGKVHPDIKEDKALIKKMVKSEAMKEGRAKKMDGGPMMTDPRLGIVKNKALEFGQNVVTPGLKSGGRAKKADGGSIRERFNAEFAKQRAAGAKNFTFEGKEYTTKLYEPTTGPSARGRGTTAAPQVKKNVSVEFGSGANTDSTGKPVYTAPRVMGTGQGTSTTAKPSLPVSPKNAIKEEMRRDFETYKRTQPTERGPLEQKLRNQYKAVTGEQMKKGGRIAKQIGGALGQAAGALSRGMPNAQAPAMGGPRSVANMGMSRPTPMGGKQQFGGQPMPATPMPMRPPGMYTTMPINPQPFNPGQSGIPVGEYGPDAFRPVDLLPGAMKGQISPEMNAYYAADAQAQGLKNAAAPMARKSGGRVARAFGGSTINEGHSKSKGKSGKTNINIIIAAGSKKEPESMVPTVPPAPMGMPPMPAPAAPAGAPMGGGMPPSAPMLGGAPGPAGGPMMPPMPRKDGGRITKVAESYKDMEAGAGSGEGRLQKTDIAKRIPKPAFEKGLNLSDARGYPNKVPGATGGRTARKEGGKVYRSYKDMDVGAGSGKGRLEKTEIQSRKK